MIFRTKLRFERRSRNVTLAVLGERVGLSIGYLSDIERGRKPTPRFELVYDIQNALGIEDDCLVIAKRKDDYVDSEIRSIVELLKLVSCMDGGLDHINVISGFIWSVKNRANQNDSSCVDQ